MCMSFDEAQVEYKKVLQHRRSQCLNISDVQSCYIVALTYLNIVTVNNWNEHARTVLEAYSILGKHNVYFATASYESFVTIEGLHRYPEKYMCKDDYNMLVCALIRIHDAVLNYLVEEYPPSFKDGVCTHNVTGVDIRADAFSYQYELCRYYDI